MFIICILALVFGLQSAATASVAPDDILAAGELGPLGLVSIITIDPATGDRTVISGCTDDACSSTIGAGFGFVSDLGSGLAVDRSGEIFMVGRMRIENENDAVPEYSVFRINPDTGDRTIVSGCVENSHVCAVIRGDGPMELLGSLLGLKVVSGPASTLSALPAWGPALLAGGTCQRR